MNKKEEKNIQEEKMGVVETGTAQQNTNPITFKDIKTFLARELKRNKALIVAFIVLVLVGIVYNFRSQLVVATVQGKPIFRWEVIKILETQMGEEAINNIVEKRLIENAATSKGLVASEDEIDLKSQEIEAGIVQSGLTLQQFLEERGYTEKEYRAELKNIIIVEKLLADRVTVSEEEIDEYIEENKENFPEIAEDPQGRSLVRENLLQNKMSMEYFTLIEELKKTGGVNILLKY